MLPAVDQPEMLNRGMEPTGIDQPGEIHGLMGMGAGLAERLAAGRDFGRVTN